VAEVVDLGILGTPPVLSGYLILSHGSGALVDAGSASVAKEYLSRARERSGGARLEYVLITHVHLDHAGGTRKILDAEPGMRAAIYTKGARHLMDPSRLMESSRQVLGGVVDLWGGMEAVDPGRLIQMEDGDELTIGDSTARLVATPGHASHSSAWYLVEDRVLFPGDSAGMLLIGEGGIAWPTAPPPFRMDMFMESLSKLESLDPRIVCVPHYGCTRRAREYLESTRRIYIEVDRALARVCDEGVRGDSKVLDGVLEILKLSEMPRGEFLDDELMRNVRGLPGYSHCSG
jgi:glyoxylase-like metal-dependent hydrolase (beta-lactamase superfamily II)